VKTRLQPSEGNRSTKESFQSSPRSEEVGLHKEDGEERSSQREGGEERSLGHGDPFPSEPSSNLQSSGAKLFNSLKSKSNGLLSSC